MIVCWFRPQQACHPIKPSYAITPPACDHFYPFCHLHVNSAVGTVAFITILTPSIFPDTLHIHPYFSVKLFILHNSHFSYMLPTKSLFCSLITFSSRYITVRYAAIRLCFCIHHISVYAVFPALNYLFLSCTLVKVIVYYHSNVSFRFLNL